MNLSGYHTVVDEYVMIAVVHLQYKTHTGWWIGRLELWVVVFFKQLNNIIAALRKATPETAALA